MFQKSFKGRTPWDRFRKIQAVSDEMLFAQIRERRDAGDAEKRSDILSLLLQARHEDGSPMSDQELRDELLTLVVAGHETSATALAWAFERLLLHPEELEKARDEVKGIVGNGSLEPAHLPKLEYVDAVLKETMRLRPILPIVVRRVHRPVTIGGFELPVGVSAAPCIYLAQRNPDIYPNPDAFEPERFLGVKTDPYSWLPFGGGIRRCLGMAFAQYEMKIVLAETLLRTQLRLVDQRPARVTRRAITLVPRGGTRVVLDRREPRRTDAARTEATQSAIRPDPPA
jgi:cytochrome P450